MTAGDIIGEPIKVHHLLREKNIANRWKNSSAWSNSNRRWPAGIRMNSAAVSVSVSVLRAPWQSDPSLSSAMSPYPLWMSQSSTNHYSPGKTPGGNGTDLSLHCPRPLRCAQHQRPRCSNVLGKVVEITNSDELYATRCIPIPSHCCPQCLFPTRKSTAHVSVSS